MKGKTAIVTGAGRGIGKAITLSLAKEGANVVVAARTKSEIAAVVSEIERDGGTATALQTDVSRETDVDNLVQRAVEKYGGVDMLINNAGIGSFANVDQLSVPDFDRMWAVNMRGVFLCSRAVVPIMRKQHAGDIVNISSLAGRNAFIGGAGYCSTKWALVGFARCLMLEVRQYNIRVITVCPGSVDTDFGDHAKTSPRSSGSIPTAVDIARAVLDTLRMPRNVMVSELDIRPTNPKK